MLPSLRTNHADRFLGKYAACYLCKPADMQIVKRAGRQTAAIAVTPEDNSDAAPQHDGCGNP